jgi:predicted DNA-binding transcriptional regulator YafY
MGSGGCFLGAGIVRGSSTLWISSHIAVAGPIAYIGLRRRNLMGMPKYDRLLYILNLLRSRRNLNAAALAEECGVTERSIYRDILALSQANIPIYYDRGYKLASDCFLPPLNFGQDEYQFLKMALESSPLRMTGKYGELADRVMAKVEAGLSDSVKTEKKLHPPATHVSWMSTVDLNRAARFFADLERAIQEYRAIEVKYNAIETGMSTRVLEPYFVVFRARAFYFVAYCRMRQDFRTFRIDRMESLRVLAEGFKPRTGVSPESYFAGSWEVYSGETVKVVAHFSGAAARVVSSSSHHPDETITPLDGDTIRYEVTVRGIEEIQRWILGFGPQAEVMEPESLRKDMMRIGRQLMEVYQTDGG